MKRLSIYDFDRTIYIGDVSLDFFLFLLRKYPNRSLLLPFQIFAFALWKFGVLRIELFKEIFFSLEKSKSVNIHDDIVEFWSKHHGKISENIKQEIDLDKRNNLELVCISASPEFLLSEITSLLGFNVLLATKMFNGFIHGYNCKGHEKVHRLRHHYTAEEFTVVKMTSDSMDDQPLFHIASQKIMVRNGEIISRDG